MNGPEIGEVEEHLRNRDLADVSNADGGDDE